MGTEFPIEGVVNILAAAVRAIVSRSEQVCIEIRTLTEPTTLLLKVAPEDLESITGRNGRTLQSLRAVTDAFSTRLMRDIYLEVAPPTQP